MSYKVSIIMYHYVRELPFTRYPNINGLKTSLFKEQLLYLTRYYNFIRSADIIASIYEGVELPKNAAWLTFDDAYSDHYDNVFPILDEMGIEGAFFAPVKAIINHEVLDVNKIHFILASVKSHVGLIHEINRLMDYYRHEYKLESNEYYYQKLAHASRFDPAEVIFVKRLLQVELPEKLRHIIANELFKKYVSENEAAFSRELYMSEDQMKCMLRHGMCIGSHGYDHCWLNYLTPEKQTVEIEKSLEFLKYIGSDTDNWIMNYPYGGYNENIIDIIKQKGCKFAVCTEVRTADLNKDNHFALPRLDTNDLPKDANASYKKTM